MTGLPEQLRRSLTWDRGKELSAHAQFKVEAGVPVLLADPHSTPGGAARTRTPADCQASTSPRAPTSPGGVPERSRPSPPRSTTGPQDPRLEDAREASTSTYSRRTEPVLRRPVESGRYISWPFGQRLRQAGLLASVGSVGDALDNTLAEVSSPARRPNCSTGPASPPAPTGGPQSSAGSRASTTPAGGIPPSAAQPVDFEAAHAASTRGRSMMLTPLHHPRLCRRGQLRRAWRAHEDKLPARGLRGSRPRGHCEGSAQEQHMQQ